MDIQFNGIKKYLTDALIWHIEQADPEVLNEVRLRLNRPLSLTCGSENIVTEYCCSSYDIAYATDRLCGGSRHTYGEMIKNGYIPAENGVRAGVCGSAVCASDGEIMNIQRIASVNIRIPHNIENISADIINLIKERNYYCSLLLYSPPMCGKTTLLRDIAKNLSGMPHNRRCTVVDTRGEIYIPKIFDSNDSMTDFLIGYPKGRGIEIACRSMSPQIIFTDEIGGEAEANAIIGAQNNGVPLIATAHASDINELMRRPQIKKLHEYSIFDYYIRISFGKNKNFDFDISSYEDIKI